MIGYTPDVVISQWLGFPTTDEGHYLTDSSAGTASEIFRNVANSVLPYTDGTQFDSVKNSYAENGIAPVGEETTETDSKETKVSLRDVKERRRIWSMMRRKQSTRPISQEKRKTLGIPSKAGLVSNQKSGTEIGNSLNSISSSHLRT